MTSLVLSALASQSTIVISLPHASARARPVLAALHDGERPGTSREALIDTLVRYGPVVFTLRVLEADKFEASVRRMMIVHAISYELAVQETSKSLSEGGTYWRDEQRPSTSQVQPQAPSEADLLPPVDDNERLLVVSWLVILAIFSAYITFASYTAEPIAAPILAPSATESLLSLPAAALDGLQ